MPRRSILSAAERESLLAPPAAHDDLIRHYTFSESDLSLIRQRRGAANRLGFAVQLCYMRYPGSSWAPTNALSPAAEICGEAARSARRSWNEYGRREQTRREHLVELQTIFGFRPFTMRHYRQAGHDLDDLASQTDKGIVLAAALVGSLRDRKVLLPSSVVIERICAEAITRGNRRIHAALNEPLTPEHRGASTRC